MSTYNLLEKKFGKYDIIILKNDSTGASCSVALQGVTILNYFISNGNDLFNIIDGFASPEEFELSRGARSWIMTPFANRISDGKYVFEGQLHKMEPIPPRTQVIHGFTSYESFLIRDVKINNDFIEVIFFTDKLRPGVNPGYPFSVDVYISLKMEENKLSIKVTGDNVGNNPAPFGCGWHPYFRTSDNGIENLILTIDAEDLVVIDDKFIPLPGKSAFRSLNDFPELDFRSRLDKKERIIGSRILDNCYSNLNFKNGIAESSIYDPENGMKISMFQKDGVTLAFSGDSLAQRKRKSVALEPMQFITNAFNREESGDKIKVLPGEKSVFEFGVKLSNE